MSFCIYAVNPMGLGLTQRKVDTCVSFLKSDKNKPKIIVLYYVEYCFIMGKPEHVEKN